MPIAFRKLTEVEAAAAFRGPSVRLDLSEYVAALQGVEAGETYALSMQAGVSVRALKRRITSAAKVQGITMQWSHQIDAEAMYFRVIQRATDEVGARRQRLGRPRKKA